MHGEETLRDFLLDAGLVSRSHLEAAWAQAEAQGETLSKTLVASGFISDDELRRASASALGIPFVILQTQDISPDALLYIPEPLARTHQMAAYASGDGVVEVALLSMDDLPAIEHLREKVNIKPRLTTRDSIKRALLLYQKHLKEKFSGRIRDEAHTDKALDALLSHALAAGAGDVQLEPRQSPGSAPEMLVRYRIEGNTYDAMTLPPSRGIVSRLKELAQLSHTLSAPQEGKFKTDFDGRVLMVRVSTLPTAAGEKISLRLMRGAVQEKGFTLESLGFHGESLDLLHGALRSRTGLVAVVGPAGSGKSTLLYTLLDILASPSRSLATIEKHIEFRLPYAAQTQAQEELGLTVAAGLRALMRHDPDVVMISDVEDNETAQLVRAAGKRILVLTGAADPSLVEDSTVSVNLHLMKRVCPQCKEEYRLTRADQSALEEKADFSHVLGALKQEGIVDKQQAWKEIVFYSAGGGCTQCKEGYRGDIGIQTVVSAAGESPNLLEDALFKAAQGLVSIEEVVYLAQ